MNMFSFRPSAIWQVFLVFLAAALATASAVSALAQSSMPGANTNEGVEALALQWFGEMQSGQIDRSQLAEEYSRQLTDGAVKGMARYLEDHAYGVPPSGAQVLKTSVIGEQTFYVVKLLFPRGDAASLMFGFNAAGKITGISLMSMAGD